MKEFNLKIWGESYRWQYEAYPLFTSVYQKVARPTNEKYFTRWVYFLNYFHEAQLEGYVPREPFLKTGKRIINELLAGNDNFIKDFDRVHRAMKNVINLCLETRKNKSHQDFKKWWVPAQKILSDSAGILFGFDYALDEFLKNKEKNNSKELESIRSNIFTKEKSFISKAHEELLKLEKLYNGDWDKISLKFIEKYGWFQNSYKGKFNITKEWLLNFARREESVNRKRKKQKIDKKFSLLVEASSKAITFRDDKKKLFLIVVDLMEAWLNELCVQKGWSFNELKWLAMDEIIKILDGGDTEILESAKRYAKNNARYGIMAEDGFIEASSKLWLGVEKTFYGDKGKIKEIKGMVGNGGKNIIGKVRVVFDSKFASINKGDILVTSMTRPEFLPLMQKAIAFITDEGGITCHAAIVAREMNKPCIIGTRIATKVLKDGDLVEVNADKGIVKKL
ncbi:MAG: PEP-utilizing enzyme [Patescibacteria group bacterium]